MLTIVYGIRQEGVYGLYKKNWRTFSFGEKYIGLHSKKDSYRETLICR